MRLVSVLVGMITRSPAEVVRNRERLITAEQWNTCADPQAMIRWLNAQGYHNALWAFAAIGCRRLWKDLPGPEFRKVVELAEQLGSETTTWAMIDDALQEAADALGRLDRKFRARALERDNRRLAAGDAVMVFGFQDAVVAAEVISRHFLEVSVEPNAERLAQTDVIRRIVPDPTRPAKADAEPGPAPERPGV